MKNILIVLLLLGNCNLFGQDITFDSIVLKKIFGKTDIGGKTFSCKDSGNENVYSSQDIVVYRIVFKKKIKLNNNDIMMIIVEAQYGTQHGHQFGYHDLYFFKSFDKNLVPVDSIKSEGVALIEDESAFKIVDIRKNKKALISTFKSTGNRHYENTKDIYLIELNKLTFLLSIIAEYDNSLWEMSESENDDCEAKRYEEKSEIINNDSDWYDIKVHHIDYGFSKGCEENYIQSKHNKEYKYI